MNFGSRFNMFKVDKYRKDFPIFNNIPNLVYLDSTATTLKPKTVIDKLNDYYTKYSANVFRGLYDISEEATRQYEDARIKIAKFINASYPSEIVFVRNTTEAINLVASSWGEAHIGKNDQIITTIVEHHSNFVPWQELCNKKGAKLTVVGIEDLNNIAQFVSKKTKLLAITHISNVLGIILPLKDIIKEVKRQNPKCLVLVDGAQSAGHMKINVADIGCDFYVFSGHKMLGPTGVGVLWAKKEILDDMNPLNYGGEMVAEVTIKKTSFKETPHKFESGTPHIAGVIGLGQAVDYLTSLGIDNITKYEESLTKYTRDSLKKIKFLTLYNLDLSFKKTGIFAFNLAGIHAHDVSQVLNNFHICIRSGFHCAMPLHTQLKITGSARASIYFYNNKKDIDSLVTGLQKAYKLLM